MNIDKQLDVNFRTRYRATFLNRDKGAMTMYEAIKH